MEFQNQRKSVTADTAHQWLEASAETSGRKRAITFLRGGEVETRLSYGQLHEDILQFASFLVSLRVEKGDRVVLLLEKSLIAVVAHFAVLRIGAIAVPLNPGFKAAELDYLLHDADARLVIADAAKAPLIAEIDAGIQIIGVQERQPYQAIHFFRGARPPVSNRPVHPQDPCLIIYTSGTTGNPKGAVLTHRNVVNDAGNVISIWDISEGDVICHALPLFHIHGLCFALHAALFSGAHVLMLDQFTPKTVMGVLSGKTDGHSCTVFMAVPTMYTKLLDLPQEISQDFGALRLLTSGSAPLLVSEFQRIEKRFGIRPVEREGMSETGMNFSNPLSGEQKPGSIGLPLPGVNVRVVNPATFHDVAEGDIGELWLKSPSITPGYWRKPVETEAAFHDGWFRTGDLGRKDSHGYYYLTDRIKHIIITGGENVSAKEVETVLNQMEGVVESSVVGVPDAIWGEKVVAAVVLKPGVFLGKDSIQAFCRQALHDWKCPKDIVFVDEIPKNTMGKMLKEVVKGYFTGP